MAKRRYGADEIDVLEGLEPVRKRPAMYIGGTDATGYHHLLWEIVDNSVDEAINGHAGKIIVTLDKDSKGATVVDDGRGIPVGIHKKYKKPAVELVLTMLHAGGKFGGKNYQVSGGLHGVGSSVVNALSESLEVKVWRDGREHLQRYIRGKPTAKLKKGGNTRKHGTSIHFRPDPKIFGDGGKFDLARVQERLEARSYLHGGLEIVLKDEASKKAFTYLHPNGIADYLPVLVESRERATVHKEAFVFASNGGSETKIEIALMWTESLDYYLRSYVNGIRTPNGGTHESGLNAAIVKAVRGFMTAKKISVKGVTIGAEDIREGGVGILSVYVTEPQFQGQTKHRLNNPEVAPAVENLIRPAIEQWLLENPTTGEAVVMRAITAARARAARKQATQQVVRKSATSHRLTLPGKLADCSSTDPETCELFIVEGDSAGGSAKQGTRSAHPGGAPLARQSAQHRAGISVQGDGQQGAAGSGHGAGLRFGQGLRRGQVALQPHLPADGCRQRRPAHLHAVVDVLLSSPARAASRRPCVLGATAALSHRRGRQHALGARRRRARPDPGRAPRQREAEDLALQGSRRDERQGAQSHRARSLPSPRAARRHRRRDRNRSRPGAADGQRSRRALSFHHGSRARRRSRKPRRLTLMLLMHDLSALHWAIAGAAIGVITLALLYLTGRRLGISTGFESVCSLVSKAPYFAREALAGAGRWRLWFLAGLLCGGFLSAWLAGGWQPQWDLGMFDEQISRSATVKIGWMFAGGLFIGFGTRFAGGCTSGHGIFGVANFEKSSWSAMAAFMIAGIVTTNLIYRLLV